MDLTERLNYYEKIYLQEIDRREKINIRLNLPLGISVALIGLLAYMLKNAPTSLSSSWEIAFLVLFSSSCLALVSAFVFFRLCWFGHTDQLMPTAQKIENYYSELKDHYTPYLDAKKHTSDEFKKFLIESYIEYSTKNATNNDRRTYNLYRTTVSITTALCFAFLSFIPFYFSTNADTNIFNHAKKEVANMANNRQPPPPPPPPGPRNVRGSVPPPPPPPPARVPPAVKKP